MVHKYRYKQDDVVGKFKIEKELGFGGVGEAYRARDTNLDRAVVLKFLRQDLLSVVGNNEELFEETKKRFMVEARAQARINHPNVCRIIDVDDENKVIILDFHEGETLQARRERGPLSQRDVVDVSLSITEAVAAAHQLKVLHRDLTMSNVMISASNRIMVLDFGLAKLTDEPGVTQVAATRGTPRYMSPEQEKPGGKVDERSDIFSIGVLLYRLVTNEFPYLRSFRDEPEPGSPPTLESFGLAGWQNFDAVVQKALRLQPDERYQDANELLRDLTQVRNWLNRFHSMFAFFDTSTLLQVVRPPSHRQGDNEQQRRAQDQFELCHVSGSAITSPSVLLELLEEMQRLYFEADEPESGYDAVTQRVVKDAKRDIQRAYKSNAAFAWRSLSPDEKRKFFRNTKGLFRETLLAMAQQLAIAEMNVHEAVSRFFEFLDEHPIPGRDSWVLAEAVSIGSRSFYSEDARYQSAAYNPILRHIRDNEYLLSSSPEDDRMPGNGSGPPVSQSSNFSTETL